VSNKHAYSSNNKPMIDTINCRENLQIYIFINQQFDFRSWFI